jgi:hypothetical protein
VSPIVAFYVSGHGFGHAVRQVEVINALAARIPDVRVHIVTTAARRVFERHLTIPVTFHTREVDTGVVQIDSLRLDPRATIERAAAFARTLPQRAREEGVWLVQHAVHAVVGDIPPLAMGAARVAGLPAIAIGNFTWDWIYAGYPDELRKVPELFETISDTYSLATIALRLPLGGGFGAFQSVRQIPLIARRARVPRDEVRTALGLPTDRPLVLVSFGGYGLRAPGFETLDCLDRYGVVFTASGAADDTAPPRPQPGVYVVPEETFYGRGFRYPDLVGAVDVVVSKPGYGIVSDCIANRTALVYTSRGPFPEYDVLVETMPAFVRCRYIDQEALFAGRWRAVLDDVLDQYEPYGPPAIDGAQAAVATILQMLGMR